MKRCVIEKKSFKAYVSRIESDPLKMYDINPSDFAHHVRHAKGWIDLGVRCGLKKNKSGSINTDRLSMLHQKTLNMQLNTEHFHGQKQVTDDDFKTIVKESDSLKQVMMKCKMDGGYSKQKILKRIEDLCIDTCHFKSRKIHKEYKKHNKLDAIDDETFKTLLKNNRTWTSFAMACGFESASGGRKILTQRIEMLGLDTNHFDCRQIDNDKIFVVDSHYVNGRNIKKRLALDFDRVYECAACKNSSFTKRDGVLMWNDQEITLQLEHINGVNNDHRPQNLCFLCPNCHSQTSTFTGRNLKKYKAMKSWLEEGKTSHAPGSIASLLN